MKRVQWVKLAILQIWGNLLIILSQKNRFEFKTFWKLPLETTYFAVIRYTAFFFLKLLAALHQNKRCAGARKFNGTTNITSKPGTSSYKTYYVHCLLTLLMPNILTAWGGAYAITLNNYCNFVLEWMPHRFVVLPASYQTSSYKWTPRHTHTVTLTILSTLWMCYLFEMGQRIEGGWTRVSLVIVCLSLRFWSEAGILRYDCWFIASRSIAAYLQAS